QAWIARVADYKASGQTMKAWCATQGVTLNQLKYWLRTLKSRPVSTSESPASFIPLALRETARTEVAPSLSLQIGGVRLEVRPGFDPQLLRSIVAALEAPC
ncbi:IS66 family insertion sequence element accessory protein TnpA, partial [Paenibacillus medicaginis]